MSSNHPIYSLAESSTSWRVNNGVDSSFHPSCSSTYSPWNDQEIDTENRLPSTTRAGLSPPSKWPRASTPRRSLSTASFNYASSSTFSLHSPPLVKSSLTVPMQSPLQRTPTNGEKASPSNLLVTPSPSRLRRNVRRSASAIARPLVLSNRSFDIGLREINFDTHSSMDNYEMWEKVDCEEENGEEELPIEIPRDDVMLSGGLAASQENSPDKTLPYTIHLETPSKSLENQDEMENEYFNLTSSPYLSTYSSLSSIHRIPEMPTGSLETSVFDNIQHFSNRRPLIFSPERTPMTLKKPRRSLPVLKEMQKPITQSIPSISRSLSVCTEIHSAPSVINQSFSPQILEPLEPLETNQIPILLLEPIKQEISHQNPSILQKRHTISSTPLTTISKGKRRREIEEDGEKTERFITPRKPLKPFARRWLRIVYGTTIAQREVTAAAHEFLRHRRESQGSM